MFWIYGIEKFNNNLVIVGKNNNSKEQQMADKNEKPMYSNILKIMEMVLPLILQCLFKRMRKSTRCI